MPNLSQVELQNLRHLIGAHETSYQKLNAYSSEAVDPQVKSNLTTYQNAISETENMELRQTLQQIRNNDESFQYELFKVAQAKGYYKPAAKASVTEIDEVKSNLQ